MIRRPSTYRQLYSWHAAYLAGAAPAQHDGIAWPGWYKLRGVKGGPWIPVEIRVEREIDPETGDLAGPERLIADHDGERRDPAKLWSFLTPISRAEYDALLHRRASIPEMAATMTPLDLTKLAMRP